MMMLMVIIFLNKIIHLTCAIKKGGGWSRRDLPVGLVADNDDDDDERPYREVRLVLNFVLVLPELQLRSQLRIEEHGSSRSHLRINLASSS